MTQKPTPDPRPLRRTRSQGATVFPAPGALPIAAPAGLAYAPYGHQLPQIRAWLAPSAPPVAGVLTWEDEGGHV